MFRKKTMPKPQPGETAPSPKTPETEDTLGSVNIYQEISREDNRRLLKASLKLALTMFGVFVVALAIIIWIFQLIW